MITKNPCFDYTMFCLNGFKKKFPNIHLSEPYEVAEWLYYMTSAFSGRDGRCNAGGGQGDIQALVTAASGLDITDNENVRSIKNKLRYRLTQAWRDNDHATIMYIARGFERGASMAVVDLYGIDWVSPYTEIDDEPMEIPEAVEDWIETFFDFARNQPTTKSCTGKSSSFRQYKRPVKSLFEEV